MPRELRLAAYRTRAARLGPHRQHAGGYEPLRVGGLDQSIYSPS
jgi:hypothetical protein